MVVARSFTEPSDECILTIHVKIEYGGRIKLMERINNEYLQHKNGELERQAIADKNFIAELMSENEHYQIVINTLKIELKRKGLN